MRSRRRRDKSRKPWLIGVAVVLVALVIAGAHNYFFVAHKAASRTSTSLPMGGHGGNTAVNSGPSHDTTPTPEPTISNNPSHSVTATLAAPNGQLLSQNSLSLSSCTSDSTNPCEEDSTCNSVAGANCFIEASKGSQTVTVSSTATIPSDTSGVELLWNAGQLSAGTWIIQAVASDNGSRAISGPWQLVLN
jgi:hypothetical protein